MLYHAECWCTNTSSQLLLAPEWQLLLARIGDSLMLHLLLHSSLFLWLPNNNYMQVAGKAIHEVRTAEHSPCSGCRWPAADGVPLLLLLPKVLQP